MYGPVEVLITGAFLFLICGVTIALYLDWKIKKRRKETDTLFRDFIDEYNKRASEDFAREWAAQNIVDNIIYHDFGTEREAMLHETEHNRLVYDPIQGTYVKYWIKDTES